MEIISHIILDIIKQNHNHMKQLRKKINEIQIGWVFSLQNQKENQKQK